MLHQFARPRQSGTLGADIDTDFSSADERADRWLELATTVLLVVVLGQALYVLWRGLFQPITDWFAFRQTQTALSAYWLWKGGDWFAYETPVLGYPWAIPFEFPLYQYLVALLRLVGVPIDVGGRLVSFGFYLGCLWPLWLLFRTYRLGRYAYLAVSILFLSSPLCLFWSRTVMIESCALFFGLLWLALLAHLLVAPRLTNLIWTILAGTAAVLAKSTTFPAFLVVGGLLFLHQLLRDGLAAPYRRPLVLAVVAFIVPLAIGSAWVAYADAVKLHNTFGTLLTSSHLENWNFGTWAQRKSGGFWIGVVLLRSMPQIFGYGFLFAIGLAGAALASRRFAVPMILATVGFLVPFLVFTNLHLVHDYYQSANALFALAAVGLGIASIAAVGHRWLASIALVCLVALQLVYFWHRDGPYLTGDMTLSPFYRIAMMAKTKTPTDSALIVIGNQWSSEVPYYAERKALVVPYWAPLTKVLENPQAFLGDRPLGGIIYCEYEKPPAAMAAQVASFIGNRKVLGKYDLCQLLAPQR